MGSTLKHSLLISSTNPFKNSKPIPELAETIRRRSSPDCGQLSGTAIFPEKILNSLTVDDAGEVCGCVFINPSQKAIVICGRATPRFDT